MKIYTTLAAIVVLTASEAVAQSPFVRCPASSSVSTVLFKLQMDITLNLAHLRDDLRKELRDAAHADTMACLAVEKAMYDQVDEAFKLRDEILRVRDEVDRLKRENALLKLRLDRAK